MNKKEISILKTLVVTSQKILGRIKTTGISYDYFENICDEYDHAVFQAKEIIKKTKVRK